MNSKNLPENLEIMETHLKDWSSQGDIKSISLSLGHF